MGTILTIGKQAADPASIVKDLIPERVLSFITYAEVPDHNQFQVATHRENREFYYLPMNDKLDDNEIIIMDRMGEKFEMITRTIRRDSATFLDARTEVNKETYLALRNMAEVGYKVVYYEFAIPDTDKKWEVTEFWDNNGAIHPWVRIELYLDKDNIVLPQLPFTINKALVYGSDENSPEENLFIDKLWGREWSRIDKRDILRV